MRKLTKDSKPAVLVANEVAWRVEFQGYVNPSTGRIGKGAPSRYRHQQIRDSLRSETSEKCAYCESLLRHVSFDHIEHILPKARRPDLVVEWSNLTLACEVCNTNKGAYHKPHAPLLHPYEDDAESEIGFLGPMAHANGHSAGYRTIRKCKLNRKALVLRRMTVLNQVEQLLRHASTLGDPVAKEMILEEVEELAADDAEYASVVRRYLQARNPGAEISGGAADAAQPSAD